MLVQNDGEDGEPPNDVNFRIQRFFASEQCSFRKKKKTVAVQTIWYVLMVTFVMLLPKKNTLLPAELEKLATPRGNTVYCLIFTILIFEAICLCFHRWVSVPSIVPGESWVHSV